MKILLIINPKAGKGRGARVGKLAEQLICGHNIDYSVIYTRYFRHAVTIAKEINTGEFNAIAAVGGDGTAFEVSNGLIKSGKSEKIALGIIPVGTGNSFSQDLGIHNNIKAAVDAIASGVTKLVDVGRYTTDKQIYYFINVLGFGFVSDVAAVANRYKALGQLSYAIGVVQITASLSCYELELIIDGKKYLRKNCFVEICNSRYTGGNMLMAPKAEIDDGFLDIILLNEISRLKLLKSFPLIFKGEHITIPQVEVFRGKKISIITNKPKILTPDGEVFGYTPIDVVVQPKCLKVYGKWPM